MMPLMRRIPSPERIYSLLRYSLASRRSEHSKAPERLPSVDNTPNTYGSSENIVEVAKPGEIELIDYRRSEGEEDTGISRAV